MKKGKKSRALSTVGIIIIAIVIIAIIAIKVM